MFLAMILTNARREEARGVVLTVENAKPQIVMLLLDGTCQPLTPPPSDILVKIIESLEQGQREFQSSVFAVGIDTVDIKRGPSSMVASISEWTIEHN